jgi:hypothetical protein
VSVRALGTSGRGPEQNRSNALSLISPDAKIIDGVLTGCDALVASWVMDKFGEGPLTVPLYYAFGVLKPEVQDMPSSPFKLAEALIAGVIFYNHKSSDNPDGVSDIELSVFSTAIEAGHPKVIR